MAEYLKKFVEGEEILAEETNDNNDYLLNQIDDKARILNDRINSINSSVMSQMKNLYPVGAIYLSVTETCPLEGVIGHWELVSSGRVLQGADSTHTAGTTISAGLPNPTGTFGALQAPQGGSAYNADGAFKIVGDIGGGVSHNNTNGFHGVKFGIDASGSNSIYGQSDTVQPPAYVVNIWERVS